MEKGMEYFICGKQNAVNEVERYAKIWGFNFSVAKTQVICLSGADWGASSQSLKIIYSAVIKSSIDYGSIVYCLANKSLLKKVEVVQSQALCICSGAFRTSPVNALQVEMGEMPLELRRLPFRMRYWAGVKCHSEYHPVKNLLKDCWEYEYKDLEKTPTSVGQ